MVSVSYKNHRLGTVLALLLQQLEAIMKTKIKNWFLEIINFLGRSMQENTLHESEIIISQFKWLI
ncbi:MAG: hypothetical protein A2583_08930 [Bdellovibrionales bacterium RIFOXYD1_FULL_53_11]|nr:MAG: hypothetical protein A2583_08930 [Bdellovibrionales bacterium RIFOXYD1_FULL_53_11]